jgi:hypothetical protein
MEMSQGNFLWTYLTQTKMSFFFIKNREQEGRTDPSGGLLPVGWGRTWGEGEEGEYGANTVYTSM